jgi:hypothetical protein
MASQTITFETSVRRFCSWAESDHHDIATARELLLVLMQGIPELVMLNPKSDQDPNYPRRTHDQWKADHKRFSDFPFQYYREIFSPCQLDEEPPVTGDVCDDFADIYGDLWHGLQALYQSDTSYALHYWKESYF